MWDWRNERGLWGPRSERGTFSHTSWIGWRTGGWAMSRRFFPKIGLPQSPRVSTGHQVPLSKTLAPGSDRLSWLRIWPHSLDFCQGWKGRGRSSKGWVESQEGSSKCRWVQSRFPLRNQWWNLGKRGPRSKVYLLYYLFTLRNVPAGLMFILLNNLVLGLSIRVSATL